ncbi:hypothetical protein MHUMG1_02152 [Metarhizium humberi]|uniref:Secreted protein n=1 Tax=Metarhizium humberi TaxID=2596975 RepID=A0A9P8MDA0_9HYPO|nr:hypothetical protein MHUMG1_02152 [Metarhizium humberi]
MSRNRWLARWWMFAAHHLLHFSSSGPVARVSGVCCAAYQALETEPEARLSFRFSANGAPAQHPGAEVLDIWSNPGASPRSGTMVRPFPSFGSAPSMGMRTRSRSSPGDPSAPLRCVLGSL